MQKRGQVIVGVFAFLLACSLVASLILPIAYEALTDDDDNGGGGASIDESVEQALRATAEAGPDDPSALLGLASYLANTGRLSEAIPHYERAIGIDPNNASYRIDFARSLAEGDLDQDAEFQFERALELEPDNPQAHFYLAELYYDADPRRVNEALDHYERTIEAGPETFVAERAAERIAELTGATPAAGTPSPA